MMPRRAFPLGALCAAALLAAPAVLAQPAYPSKPITIVVPFAAGGVTDMVGRLVGKKMGESLKQTVRELQSEISDDRICGC